MNAAKYTIYMKNENAENLMNKLIAAAHQSSSRYISPLILRQMYRSFCLWREVFQETEWQYSRKDSKRMLRLKGDFIHYFLERCYWVNYGDSDTITDLLKELFLLDGHLGKIFDYQQLSITPRKRAVNPETCNHCFLASTWSEAALSNEKTQPFHYFLEHADKKQTLFDGKRFAEQYFVQCIWNKFHVRTEDILLAPPCARVFTHPEILTCLLQHGLFANSSSHEQSIGKILTGIIGVILNSNQDFRISTKYTTDMIQVGNVLLRAVSSVNISSLLKDQKIKNKEKFINYLVNELSVQHYLPKLKRRCKGPQELQHICRRSIRSSMYITWNLPKGIEFLPLPRLLKEYIRLQRD